MRIMILLLLLGSSSRAMAQAEEKRSVVPLERIRVNDDKTGFVRSPSGKPYRAWGFNYLGTHDVLAEESWESDPDRVVRDLREMKSLGANVVRWHLQLATYMTGPDEVNQKELDRLKWLLDQAEAAGLYLDLTGLSCYRLKNVPAWFDALDEAQRWDVQARFWEAIASTCKGRPVVFCYDLMNEPVIGAPKEGTHPWLGGELGGYYFVQRISHGKPGVNSQQIAAQWNRKMVEVIRKHDKETLVTVGVIPWAQVFPKAKPLFYSPEAGEMLDFTSVHFYPKTGQVTETLTALDVYRVGKPIVVEETFPLSCSQQELEEFMDRSDDKVAGWMGHYFGKSLEETRKGTTLPEAITAKFFEFWKSRGPRYALEP